jgi:hypothetical protein
MQERTGRAPEIVSNDLNHSVAGTGRSTTYQGSLPPAHASSRIQAGSIPRRATNSHHLWGSSVLAGSARAMIGYEGTRAQRIPVRRIP